MIFEHGNFLRWTSCDIQLVQFFYEPWSQVANNVYKVPCRCILDCRQLIRLDYIASGQTGQVC